MPKLTDKDSYFGSVIGRWMGGTFDGAGALAPRIVAVDFGYPNAASPLNNTTAPVLDSEFIDYWTTGSIPGTLQAGAATVVEIQMKNPNSATVDWTPGVHELRPVTAAFDVWGVASVALGGVVAPGATEVFTLNTTAPLAAGTYQFSYQMYDVVNGVFFGDASPVVTVTVLAIPVADIGSVTNIVGFPLAVAPGALLTFDLDVNNTGTVNWLANDHLLSWQIYNGNTVISGGNALIPVPVAFGASATLNFPLGGTIGPIAPNELNSTFYISFAIQTTAGNGAVISSWTDQVLSDFTVTQSCATMPPPSVSLDPTWSQHGPYTYGYVVAFYTDQLRTTLVGATTVGVLSNAPTLTWTSPGNTRGIVIVGVQPVAGSTHAELYRTITTAPLYGESTTGLIRGADFPDGTSWLEIPDSGLAAEVDGATAPSCAAPPAPKPAPTAEPNILTSIICDGSTIGTIIDGELVIDYIDSTFPLNNSNWPTADWPRTVVAQAEGQPVIVRVIGIDGWGRIVSDRMQADPGGFGVGSVAFWKIKRIVIENPSTGLLWLGWGNRLGLPYPASDIDGTDGYESGQLIHAWIDDVQMPPAWTERWGLLPLLSTSRIFVYPATNDARGLYESTKYPPTGADRHRIAYLADNLEHPWSTRWNIAFQAGLVPFHTE